MTIILKIAVIPLSRQCRYSVDDIGTIKCYLKSAPEKGKANQELIRLLSEALKIRQSDIQILTGVTSSRKRVKIATGLSKEEIIKKISGYNDR